jgi:hypothetical protein
MWVRPVNEADLLEIERTLGLRLPTFYSAFLLNHSAELEQWAESLLDRGQPLRSMPFYTASEVISSNSIARLPSERHFLNNEWVSWPAEYLIVGKHGCDDNWLIRVDGKDTSIWTYWTDLGVIEPGYESFEELLDEIRNGRADEDQ